MTNVMMQFLPIDIDETKNARFLQNKECLDVLGVYPAFYQRVGYHPPWIGYFVSYDGEEMIGVGGFKGAPKDGRVEIAYGTFEKFEGKGIGTEICRQLVLLALQTDPSVIVAARTLKDGHASMRILQKNGFDCIGTVLDEDDGEVLEWQRRKTVSGHPPFV